MRATLEVGCSDYLPRGVDVAVRPSIFFGAVPSCLPSYKHFKIGIISHFPGHRPTLIDSVLLCSTAGNSFLTLVSKD